ncbi:energy-coupling factor ABC transporter permease [Granulosicoccus sp. 3-233]|uniref:energy-coupling factor ABC transporter permease n=1 Tax=Granulosicoccus sp. 3-233 TaxID=3417969 RepID=UPI003D326A27
MHMEPGIVEGSKILLSHATAATALVLGVSHVRDAIRQAGVLPLAIRSMVASVLVFLFFEVFPHVAVGISEVHLILGTTLLLLFGVAPAAIGLMLGLLSQGLLFAPADLPQYGMNVTTLLLPLFATHAIAQRIIPANTAYVDIGYAQAFKLSLAYQGGIVLWVGFWAIYGNGIGAENMAQVTTFGLAYMTVVLIEPLIDLAVLAGARMFRGRLASSLLHHRLHAPLAE